MAGTRGDGIIEFPTLIMVEIKESIGRLNALVKDYRESIQDPVILEPLKKEFAGELSRYVELFSKVKAYKGGTHTYVEEERKMLKARIVKQMDGSHTKNLELVYDHPDYVAGYRKIEDIRAFFIEVELKYEIFCKVLDALIQSNSIAQKEKQHANSY